MCDPHLVSRRITSSAIYNVAHPPSSRFSLLPGAATGQVDQSLQRKRRSHGTRKSQFDVRSADEITDEDLDNVAYRSKDKIWDKEKVQISRLARRIAARRSFEASVNRPCVFSSPQGSSCHQCRQKTLDTKTICRSGFCVGAKGQFCGPCLKNRYGEDVRTVLLDPVSADQIETNQHFMSFHYINRGVNCFKVWHPQQRPGRHGDRSAVKHRSCIAAADKKRWKVRERLTPAQTAFRFHLSRRLCSKS